MSIWCFTLAGIGKFHPSGDYRPWKVYPAYGFGVELGDVTGTHNMLMEIYLADTKQGEGTRHRFASSTKHVMMGYISYHIGTVHLEPTFLGCV